MGSRARFKRRKKAIERASQNSYVSFNEQAQALMAQMKAMQKSNSGVIYSPGLPLQPQPGVNPEGVPRQYSFPLAYNTSVVDRTRGTPGMDIPSFDQLRLLAEMYSGITISERVWLDLIPNLELKIGLTKAMKKQGYDDKDFQDEITTYEEWFEYPDGVHDTHSWLRMAIRDQTQIDALSVFKQRTRGGQLLGLPIVDGTTIKPLLDDWGRVPAKGLPAYQQYLWGGLPGNEFTTDQMIYYRESPRSNSPFGFSRVERFPQEINIALRKRQQDLSRFTEGNIPPAIIEVPVDSKWTPDDIRKYEALWNSLVAGNPQQQVRLRFMQPGMKYVKIDNDGVNTEVDIDLFKIALACYGLSPADVGITGDIHKSADKGQQSMLYRRTLNPLVVMYAKLFFTNTIRKDFKDPRFVASFIGYEEEEDQKEQADTFAEMAGVGAIAPSDIAHLMGYPDVPKTGPFIMTKDGPFFLKDYEEGSDMRNAQKQAQMAGMQLAAQNPADQNDEENEDTEDEDSQQEQEKTTAKGGSKATPKSDDQTKKTGSSTRTDDKATRATQGTAVNSDQAVGQATNADYRRWRTRAIEDVKLQRAQRPFASSLIPDYVHAYISFELDQCKTTDNVRDLFKRVQDHQMGVVVE